MASLVAYGDSSGSESDNDDAAAENTSAPSDTAKPVNFLTDNVQASDDSEDNEDKVEETKLPNPLSDKKALPPPNFGKSSKTSKLITRGSIYENPFENAELAKHSVLEQHVKMTANEQEEKNAGGKKICWNFRKGKCRFGRKCKYSHGNDVVGVKAADEGNHRGGNYGDQPWTDEPVTDPADDDSYMGQAKRKKRHGINDTMNPSKRAMKDLHKIRTQERPWTTHQ